VRTIDVAVIEHGDRVLHERRHVDRPGWLVAASVPPMVVGDHVACRGERRDVAAPAVDVAAEPFEQQQRWRTRFPVGLDVETAAVRGA
jgi:hypothetical protein